jgi:hypothetical protein
MQVQQVIANLRQQARTLREALEEVDSAVALLESVVPDGVPAKHKGKGRKSGKRKPMSAAARKKISEAAKARWAAKKAGEK